MQKIISGILLLFFQLIYLTEGNFCNGPHRCVKVQKCPVVMEMMKRRLTAAERDNLKNSQCKREVINNKIVLSVCCPIPLPTQSECGVHYNDPDKIIGGTKTLLEEYPWTALLRHDGGGFQYQLCGGSLINNRYILTAAHCLKRKNMFTGKTENINVPSVRLGEWNKTSEIDCDNNGCADPIVEVNVEKIIPHPNFVPGSSNYHDIALLRLAENVNYTKFIQPICLPLTDNMRNTQNIYSYDVCGWGKTENTNYTSEIKLKAKLPAVSLKKCAEVYNDRHRLHIINSQICAGGEKDVDSCKGDSGGPLMALNYENIFAPKHYLAGIVSFGPNPCAQHGVPGVYTNVGSYMNWIFENIEFE